MACNVSSFLSPYQRNYGLVGTYHDLAADAPKCCLITLESVSADIIVRGFVAQVSANLTYCNTTQHVLQVRAVLPVDESAAVYHCEARLGERTIVTHCMEKKKAEEAFAKAVKEGKTAVMTREHELTTDILSLDLGNLPAGSKANINLRLIMELKVKGDGGVSFVLPTILNPRYYPQDHQELMNMSQSRIRDECIVLAPQPYDMEVKATIKGSHRIARVTSNTDDLTVTLQEDDMTAQVRQDSGFQSDHDWSMLVYYNNPYQPHVLRETGDRSGTGIMKDDLIMLNFFPEVSQNSYSNKNEFIFVIDRSGSMQGTKMVNARATLLLFLKSLPPGCLFNVVSFGSTFSVLFSNGSETYNEKSLDKACNLCAFMEADMGGTEILCPLQSIYSKEPSPQYSRQILLITDGQVFNVDQVTQLVGRHSHETRVFCVGIGGGASTALVQGVAMAGRGRAEMVQDGDSLQQSVMDLMSSMVQESVLEVQISCEVEPASRVRLVPKVPPVIFGGQHVILYARVPPDTQVKKVSLRGKTGTHTIEETLEGQHFTVVHDEAKSLHRLAARAQIRQWQLDEEEDVAEEMLALSLSSGVVCRRTALIGIDQESGAIIPEPKPMHHELLVNFMTNASLYMTDASLDKLQCSSGKFLRLSDRAGSRSPSPLPPSEFQCLSSASALHCASGLTYQPMCKSPRINASSLLSNEWQKKSKSMPSGLAKSPSSLYRDESQAMPHAHFGGQTTSSTSGFQFCSLRSNLEHQQRPGALFGAQAASSTSGFGFGSSMSGYFTSNQEQHQTETTFGADLMEVVNLQKFDGSWKLQDAAKVSGVPIDDLSASNPAKVEESWATALVLVVLERKFDAQRNQWALIAVKAHNFITSCGDQPEDLLAKARLTIRM